MPFPSRKDGRRRVCCLCKLPELTRTPEHGAFTFVPDRAGRGPRCPRGKGCNDRQKQLVLKLDIAG